MHRRLHWPAQDWDGAEGPMTDLGICPKTHVLPDRLVSEPLSKLFLQSMCGLMEVRVLFPKETADLQKEEPS